MKTGRNTQLIHAGEPRPRIGRAVNVPIFQSSIFEIPQTPTADSVGVQYIRLSNTPNHLALQEKLAALEGTENALVTSSGMAAISAALLTFLKPGDHALFSKSLYGGTDDFVTHDLSEMGISVDFIDPSHPESWAAGLRPNSKVLYMETMTNPGLEVGCLDVAASFAKAHGLTSMIDNTFATPLGFRPTEWGFDLSLHSASKYLNGHSDLLAGAVLGSHENIRKVRRKLARLGGSLDPHTCFLLHRGLKTLGVRFRHQCQTAMLVAEALSQHPAVARVNFPGLETHLSHARARRFFDAGLYGGVLSFIPKGGVEAADKFLRTVELAVIGPSLGGIESLATRPATTSHSGMTKEARERAGVTDDLVRVSVGLEDPEDLIQDFSRALDA